VSHGGILSWGNGLDVGKLKVKSQRSKKFKKIGKTPCLDVSVYKNDGSLWEAGCFSPKTAIYG
jgi:hypothetical protein